MANSIDFRNDGDFSIRLYVADGAQRFLIAAGDSVTVSIANQSTHYLWSFSSFDPLKTPATAPAVAKSGAKITVGGSAKTTLTPGKTNCDCIPNSHPEPFPDNSPVNVVRSDSGFHTIRREILTWNDPFTLPHTRTDCVKEAWGNWYPGGPEWRICWGWATRYSWFWRRAILVVVARDPDPANAIDDNVFLDELKKCHEQAAVITAASALMEVYSGAGIAAAATLEQTYLYALSSCIIAKVNSSSWDIRIEYDEGWTPYS